MWESSSQDLSISNWIIGSLSSTYTLWHGTLQFLQQELEYRSLPSLHWPWLCNLHGPMGSYWIGHSRQLEGSCMTGLALLNLCRHHTETTPWPPYGPKINESMATRTQITHSHRLKQSRPTVLRAVRHGDYGLNPMSIGVVCYTVLLCQ